MYDELNGIGILTDSCSPVNRDFLLLTSELKSAKMSNGEKDSNPVRGEMFIETGIENGKFFRKHQILALSHHRFTLFVAFRISVLPGLV